MQAEDSAAQLDALQGQVLALGDRVEGMLIQAADLLQRCDLEGLEQLGEEERRVNQLGLATEKVVSICE